MTEFETTAVLGIRIPDRETRSAKREIEDSMGSVTIPVEADTRGIADGGRSSTAALAGGAGVVEELGDQTDLLVDIKDELEKIGMSSGGGGGGLLGGASGVAIGSMLTGGGSGLLGTVLGKGKAGITRGLKGASKGLGRRIPLLNTAIYGAEALGERSIGGLANVTGGFLGGTAGAIGGAKAGAAVGGTLGSVIPGAGTAVGAGAGAIVGGVAGGVLGDKAGRNIADSITQTIGSVDLSPPSDLWPTLSVPGDFWPNLTPPDDLWPDRLDPPDSFWSVLDPNDGDGEIDSDTTDAETRGSVTPESWTIDTVNGQHIENPNNDAGATGVPDYVSSMSGAEKQELGMLLQRYRRNTPGMGIPEQSLSKGQRQQVNVTIQEVTSNIDGRSLSDALQQKLQDMEPEIRRAILNEIESEISTRP